MRRQRYFSGRYRFRTRSAVALFLMVLLMVSALLPLFSLGAEADSAADATANEDIEELPDLSSVESCLLYNIDSKSVMFSSGGKERVYPTATVKLMVAYTAYSFLSERLDDVVTISREVVTGAAGVNMELRNGEQIPVRDLFSGLLIAGANDAALALALESCGNVDVFIARMNENASKLGMRDTVYVNVTGIDNVLSYTTAEDVLKLSLAVYDEEFLRETVSLPLLDLAATNEHRARTLHARNYLLSRRIYPYYYMSEATGMNAGSTTKGGNCLVATASLQNVRYLCIVMGGQEVEGIWNGEPVKVLSSFTVAKELLNWGSRNYEYRTVVSPMNIYGEIRVELSSSGDYVTVVPLERVQIFVPKNGVTEDIVRVETEIFHKSLTAPVDEGYEVGWVTVISLESGEIVGRTPLVTKSSINISQWLYIGAKLLEIVRTDAFVVTVCLIAAGSLIGVLVTARMRFLKQRRRALREDDR